MTKRTSAPAGPWEITIHDGANNAYLFRQTEAGADTTVSFEYRPVQPAASSSGVYSGGRAIEGSLDAPQIQELWTRVAKLESAPDLRIEARTMGSGMFRISTTAGSRRFIVRMGVELADFCQFLSSLKDRACERKATP